MKHTLKWFLNRIGKRIYRNKTSCKCYVCCNVYTNGLIVTDKFHAEYLEMIQNDIPIDYRDKKGVRKLTQIK